MKNIKRFYKVNERNLFPSPCRLAVMVAMFLLSFTGFSQNPVMKVFEDWNDATGSQNTFQQSVVRSKGTGGVVYHYVAGATLNSSGNYDMMVSKYTAGGALLWTQTYNGAGNGDDVATDMQISSSGYVFITGTYYENSTDSNNAITIMYNSSGVQQWASTYNGNGSGNDGTVALYYDGVNRETYCVGSEWDGSTNMYDMLVIKYDFSGNQLWVTTFDDANWEDLAYRVGLNKTLSTVYVAGGSMPYAGNYDYSVLSIKASSGSINSSYTTGLTPLGIDKITDLQIDGNGNAFVTGGAFNGTSFDYLTARLDTALIPIWSAQWDDPSGLDDIATGLSLDSSGNVFVTGSARTTSNGVDYATIKYDSTGTQIWVTTFDGAANGNDSATGIVVKDTNQIYVTGRSFNGSTDDYYTIKYDMSGNRVWEIGFNSLQNGDDAASAIALDTLGGIVVTGQNRLGDSTFAYTTVKYVEKSTMSPQDTIAATSSSFVFTENRGQLLNTSGDSIPQVRYYTIYGSPNVYFTDTTVSIVLAKLDTSSSHNDTLIRVDMKFLGANSDLRIRSMDVRGDYENFFLGHIPEGRCQVQNFDKLINFNVWNNVDVMYGSNLKGLKIYFTCKPGGGGGSYANIDLKFNGADSIKINGSGQLIVYTKLGNIIYPKAAAWQIDGSGNFSSLGWQPSYSIVATNEVKFTSLGSYNNAQPLIFAMDNGDVQPQNIQNLTWSTFYGAGGNNLASEFRDVHVMKNKHVLACGFSNEFLFPLLNQFYGPNPSGGYDATVVKFKPTGEREWATYYGGTTDQAGNNYAGDYASGIDADSAGNVFFTGATYSTDFPMQPWGGAYFDSSNTCTGGGCTKEDVFIAQLSPSGGGLIWSTYYGGNGQDNGGKIRISPWNQDIYVVGYGEAGFPLDSSQAVWNSQYGTGFILRFDKLGVRKWATKIGCVSSPSPQWQDGVDALAIDKKGDIAITGRVIGSLGFPISQNSCSDSSNNVFGGAPMDAFITKFSGNNNALLWSTFYGGSCQDAGVNIAVDTLMNYYITGMAQGGSFCPSPPLVNPGNGAYYQGTWGGGTSDAFIAEFDQNGCLTWSTFYGSTGDDEGGALTLDSKQNLYFYGRTSGSIPFANPNLQNAYVDATSSNWYYTLFINAFKAGTHEQVWTTYFGDSYSIYSPAIASSGDSAIYIVGTTNAYGSLNGFPLDNGGGPPVWFQDTIHGFTAFISRFDINPAIVGISELSDPDRLDLNIYPNPTQNSFWITGSINTKDAINIEVFDLLGQVTYSEKVQPCITLHHEINLDGYANGIYIVHVRTGDKIFTRKIIIQQ